MDGAGPAGSIDGANERAANSPLDVGTRTPPPTVPWKPGNRPPGFHTAHRPLLPVSTTAQPASHWTGAEHRPEGVPRELRSGQPWLPSADERFSVYWRLVELMREHFGADARGRKRCMYFLPWHFGFFCRYREVPDTPEMRARALEHPLLQSRLPLGPLQGALDRLLADARPETHTALAETLLDSASHDEARARVRLGRHAASDHCNRTRAGAGARGLTTRSAAARSEIDAPAEAPDQESREARGHIAGPTRSEQAYCTPSLRASLHFCRGNPRLCRGDSQSLTVPASCRSCWPRRDSTVDIVGRLSVAGVRGAVGRGRAFVVGTIVAHGPLGPFEGPAV